MILFLLALFIHSANATTTTIKDFSSDNGMTVNADGSLNVDAAVSSAPNTNGSFVQSLVVGSSAVVSFSPPIHAVGFMIESSSSNTKKLRYAIVTTPTTSSGMRLEPGRDSGFIPTGAIVNVIAESGSNQEVEITWVLSQ